MHKVQYTQKNAATNTLVVLNNNTEYTADVEAIATVGGEVQVGLDRIETLIEEQERDRKGITEKKETARGALVDALLPVCGQLIALGKRTGDADMRQRASGPRSAWLKVPQGKLAGRATSILELARTHRAALTPFGTTGEGLTKLEAAITAFEAALALPRDVINRRKTITGLIRDEIKIVCTTLREELDPLMRQFEATHPQFYTDYHNARALVDLPTIPRAKREASRKAAAERKASKAKSRKTTPAAAAKADETGQAALNG